MRCRREVIFRASGCQRKRRNSTHFCYAFSVMNRRELLGALMAAVFKPSSLMRYESALSPATVYELRVYHVNEGKLDDLLRRFRDHTVRLFEKHGMKNVAYWTPTDDT